MPAAVAIPGEPIEARTGAPPSEESCRRDKGEGDSRRLVVLEAGTWKETGGALLRFAGGTAKLKGECLGKDAFARPGPAKGRLRFFFPSTPAATATSCLLMKSRTSANRRLDDPRLKL